MLQGKSFQVLTDNEDPAKSTNTDIVMAWYTLGGKLAPQPFEKVEEDGRLRVSWIVETTTKADINGELIEFGEFQKRWNDLEWCKANEWHAISVMRAFRDNSRDAKRWARKQATGVLKRKGNAICVAYPNSPDWLKKEMARFV